MAPGGTFFFLLLLPCRPVPDTGAQFLRKRSLHGQPGAKAHRLSCQHSGADFFCQLPVRQGQPVLPGKQVHGKEALTVRSRSDHRFGMKKSCQQERQGIRPSRMSRQKGNAVFSRFIHYQHRRIFGLMSQPGRNAPHRNTRRAEENQCIRPVKPLSHTFLQAACFRVLRQAGAFHQLLRFQLRLLLLPQSFCPLHQMKALYAACNQNRLHPCHLPFDTRW